MRHLLALLVLLAAWPAHAQTEGATTNGLRVGVAERPPFATYDETLGWTGLAVDLFRQIAEEQGIDYVLEPLEKTPREAVAGGDVVIAFPADAGPRDDGVAFSQPFYTSTLGLAKSRSFDLLRIAGNIVSWQFVRVLLFLGALLLVVGAIVWLIERRENDEMFPRKASHGLGAGFWWAGVTMTTIGYGDKAPITVAGRAVAMLWMLVAMAITAAFTATVVSAIGLTGGSGLPNEIEGRVGVVEESTAERYLRARGKEPVIVADVTEGLERIGETLDAFLGDEPLVRSVVEARSSLDLSVTGSTIDPQYITFAVADNLSVQGERLEKRFNRAILKRLPTPEWWELTQRYIPGDD